MFSLFFSFLSFVAEFLLAVSDQSARLGRALSFDLQPGSEAEHRFLANRAEHDPEDHDLGAAAMDENTEAGGGEAGGEAGGSGL